MIADSGERLLGNKKTNVVDEAKNKEEEASKNLNKKFIYLISNLLQKYFGMKKRRDVFITIWS